MPIDTKTVGSPGWELQRLARKMAARQKRLRDLDERFKGNPPLPEGAENCRDVYRKFQKKARTNFAELIVEAVRERMNVTGFRTAAPGDDNGDGEARVIWEANRLDVESADLHESFLTLGEAYTMVGPGEKDGPNALAGPPIITNEDPLQIVTSHDPVRPRRVLSALKMWQDADLEREFAYLYLPGEVHVATRPSRRLQTAGVVRFSGATWDWDEELSTDLPIKVVPVVRFLNRRGVGEFEPHIDILDRINHQVLQRMVIATMQAFRQRAVKGLQTTDDQGNPLKDPVTGQLIDFDQLLAADPGALWKLPQGVDLWESSQVELSGILTANGDDLKMLAAVTRTPISYLNPDAVNQSAEGASLTREGLVFKTEDRLKRATEGWKDTMSLAFLFANDENRADRSKMEVMWAPVDRPSLAEKADAASKAPDVPWRTKMTDIWGFSAVQVDRMEAERSTDAFLAGVAAPPAVVAPASVVGP